jgi:hypothetical protein
LRDEFLNKKEKCNKAYTIVVVLVAVALVALVVVVVVAVTYWSVYIIYTHTTECCGDAKCVYCGTNNSQTCSKYISSIRSSTHASPPNEIIERREF